MNLESAPADTAGLTAIPDLSVIRASLVALHGSRMGSQIADRLPVKGWRVVFDLRLDGLADGFVCERRLPDGSVQSTCWNAAQIRAFGKTSGNGESK
jgi:hypothetical protein